MDIVDTFKQIAEASSGAIATEVSVCPFALEKWRRSDLHRYSQGSHASWCRRSRQGIREGATDAGPSPRDLCCGRCGQLRRLDGRQHDLCCTRLWRRRGKARGRVEETKLALLGIGNYSSEHRSEADSNAEAHLGWHDFGARYDFPATEAWTTWAAGHGAWLKQGEFAEFIETRLYDLSSPNRGEELSEAITRFLGVIGGDDKNNKVATPSKLFELSRGLKITSEAKIEQRLDRNSGETTLVYAEEHSGPGGHPIKVPKMFYIRIPVFFGQAPALIGAILRYRVAGAGIVWSYELFAPDVVVKEQFEIACKAVTAANRTLYLGSEPDKQPQ